VKRNTKLTQNQKQEIYAFIRKGISSGREVRRAQAVLLVDEDVDITAIRAVTGYKHRQIFTVRKKYLEGGIEAIKDKQKGKPKELLAKKQREEIIETIKTKKPSELGAYYQNYDYWTTGILGVYVERTYEVKYKSKTSHYLLFKEARFTYHKPGRVSQRRSEKEVQEWQKSVAAPIKTAWADPHTVILTEDEMHLSNQTTVQKIWLPKGEYPRIEVARKRESRSIYGFLNIKTGQEHAFKTQWQNMYITAEILPKVRALYPQKKILLLWDQAGWHKGSEAQKIIKEDGNIETLYFPTAAPEENPQEHVWKSGRSQCAHNRFMEDMNMATDEFVTYLNATKFPYSLLGFSARS
jgi:transposase